MLWYSTLFNHLTKWCLATAIAQFVVFLFIFLGISYLSTLIKVNGNEFVSNYEKNIVLSSSLYMVVPFALSSLFLFGLFHKNPFILKIFMTGSLINCVVILIAVIGSGIFLAVKGTDYIAYSLIAVGLFLELFLGHGIMLAFGIRNKYLQKAEVTSIESNNSMEDT